MNNMTPEQALQVLSGATEPGVQPSRRDYVVIEQALQVLAEAIKPKTEKSDGNSD